MKTEITKSELTAFTRCHNILKKINQAFLDGAEALREMRDKKLYRHKYETFEEYCQEEHGWGRQRAYQLIEASEIKKSLPENVNNCLQNEGQVRALSSIHPEYREEVIEKVVSEGKVTAEAIKDAGEVVQKKDKTIRLDKMGYRIPEEIIQDWDRSEQMGQELKARASFIKCAIETGLEDPKDVIWREINNQVSATAKNLFSSVKLLLPYAICPSCEGRQRKKCTVCKQRGWVSEFLWKTAFPPEIRTMRESMIERGK